jgi:hypothetical protein
MSQVDDARDRHCLTDRTGANIQLVIHGLGVPSSSGYIQFHLPMQAAQLTGLRCHPSSLLWGPRTAPYRGLTRAIGADCQA